MRHSISAKFQSISQWVVLDTTDGEQRVWVDPVLRLLHSTCLKLLGLQELRPYEISDQAYGRGYGTADEIVAMSLRWHDSG